MEERRATRTRSGTHENALENTGIKKKKKKKNCNCDLSTRCPWIAIHFGWKTDDLSKWSRRAIERGGRDVHAAQS